MLRPLLLLLACLLALPAHAAKVRIQGMRSMTEAAALELISARLEYMSKRDASASRADDAAFLLNRLLIQRGFTSPKVDWDLPGGNLIVLKVTEGLRSTVGKVYIDGVRDPDLHELMRRQIRSAHKARSIELGKATPFLKEHHAEAITDAQRLLHSRGYWDAQVESTKTPHRPGSTDVDLFVKAIPGPLYYLHPLKFDGGEPVHPDLLARLKKKEFAGQVATAATIRLIRARVEKFYRERGHQFAEVKMLAEHRNGKTQLNFILKPGPRYRVGDIKIAGQDKVKPHLVEKRFESFVGENYNSAEVSKEIRELLGSGAFAGIRLEAEPQNNGLIDLTLHLTESNPKGYYFYGGAGSFEGPIIGAGYFNRDLFGNLWNLSTRTEWSGLGLLGEVSVTEPRFLGYDLRLTPSAHLTTRSYPGYNKAETGINAELKWEVTNKYVIKGYFQNSLVALSSDGLPRKELGPDAYLLHVLGLTQEYDTRDSSVLPKKGFYGKLTTDLGLALGTDSVSFVRTEGQASVYRPIFKKGTVALGARAGVIIPNGSDANLPVDLRYFLGGGNTVRSFPDRELGPEAVNGVPRGGESYWVGNAEYIHSINTWLSGVAFFDAGALNRDHGTMFAGDIKYALGLGLRLNLPIGPVRLEYGHALNPEGNEHSGAFHFAIGSAF